MALPHYCSGGRLWPQALKAWVELINTARFRAGLPMVHAGEIEAMSAAERFDVLTAANQQAIERDRLVEERGVFVDAAPVVDGEEDTQEAHGGENDDAE